MRSTVILILILIFKSDWMVEALLQWMHWDCVELHWHGWLWICTSMDCTGFYQPGLHWGWEISDWGAEKYCNELDWISIGLDSASCMQLDAYGAVRTIYLSWGLCIVRFCSAIYIWWEYISLSCREMQLLRQWSVYCRSCADCVDFAVNIGQLGDCALRIAFFPFVVRNTTTYVQCASGQNVYFKVLHICDMLCYMSSYFQLLRGVLWAPEQAHILLYQNHTLTI